MTEHPAGERAKPSGGPGSTGDRWRLEVEITTLTSLHIGGGSPTKKERRTNDGMLSYNASAVVVDYLGRAYLPGKAIKGALRSWLAWARGLPAGAVEQLFGSEVTRKKDSSGGKGVARKVDSFGGKAEFRDAFCECHDPSAEKAPGWDGTRLTGVVARTAAARTTKTARNEKLFHEEFVPPGVTFTVVVTGQDLSEEEAAVLLFALGGFGDPAFPVRLGSGEQNLRGAFTLDPKTIRLFRLTRDAVGGWLKQRGLPRKLDGWRVSGGGYDGLPEVPELLSTLEAKATGWKLIPPPRLTATIELTFDPAFMVHDPSRGQEATGNKAASDHPALLDTADNVLLPADSFRGAFRTQAERILHRLGVHACDPQGPDACPAIHAEEDRAQLCRACRVFGAGGWASALLVSDFSPTAGGKGTAQRQDFAASDRFTGGVSGSRKFDAEPFWNPVLEGTIALELDRADPWSLGLLALALRDLIEGDVAFGFGAGKGYGACTARVVCATGPEAGNTPAKWEELATAVRQPVRKGPWGVLDLEGFVARFRSEVSDESVRRSRPLPGLKAHEPTSSQADDTGFQVAAIQPAPVAAGESRFLNPYHFVPAGGTGGRVGLIDAEAFFGGNVGHVTHDRYVDGKLSGRLLLKLTAEDPFLVGSKQVENPDGSHTVTPFTIDGRPAIPATSLRGLVSAIAEASSDSAMRVLDDRSLSVRMTVYEALPAIGMIREVTRDGKKVLELQPLTFPTNLRCNAASLPGGKQGVFGNCWPMAYVDGYQRRPNPKEAGSFLPGVEKTPGSFLETRVPLSYSADHREFWYAKVFPFNIDDRGAVSFPRGGERRDRRSGELLLGSLIEGLPLSEAEYEKEGRPLGYVRGIVRVLGFDGHEKEIPHGKKHEIFIPFSPDQENGATAVTFAVDGALAAFEKLAAERVEAEGEDGYLPFDLKRPGPAPAKKAVKLKDGDLVFFKASGTTISEIALSSIWRKGKASVHAYFRAFSPELLPMNPARRTISIAECLFGFVEELKKGDAKKHGREARAFAGRVRVSFGRLDPGVQEGQFWQYDSARPLKLLASPKPPCPALYFTAGDGGVVAKKALAVGSHRPLGRKFYLHRPPGESEPWIAEGVAAGEGHAKQRLWANPVRKDSVFYFHVDFDNLSKDELGLLCYGLRPTGTFRHKLGLGKPIGLGRVRVDPVGIFYVPRGRRYRSDPLAAPRYHAVPEAPRGEAPWPWAEPGERYAREASAPGLAAAAEEEKTGCPAFETVRDQWREGTMDARIRWAIELLGDPGSVAGLPVHYPRLADQGEEELYRWFVENERQGHSALAPIQENLPLPSLPHLTPPPRADRQPGGHSGGGQRGGAGHGPHRGQGGDRRP